MCKFDDRHAVTRTLSFCTRGYTHTQFLHTRYHAHAVFDMREHAHAVYGLLTLFQLNFTANEPVHFFPCYLRILAAILTRRILIILS